MSSTAQPQGSKGCGETGLDLAVYCLTLHYTA